MQGVRVNNNQAHYRLLEIAAELARCQALRSLDAVEDWPASNIGRARVLQMLEIAEREIKNIAFDVREAADVQAMEISRLRSAIDQVVREQHVPSTGICALHIVAGECV